MPKPSRLPATSRISPCSPLGEQKSIADGTIASTFNSLIKQLVRQEKDDVDTLKKLAAISNQGTKKHLADRLLHQFLQTCSAKNIHLGEKAVKIILSKTASRKINLMRIEFTLTATDRTKDSQQDTPILPPADSTFIVKLLPYYQNDRLADCHFSIRYESNTAEAGVIKTLEVFKQELSRKHPGKS